MKPYIVRKIDWKRKDERGIPLDCIDIMNYFNYALERELYPFVPRQEPITEGEILSKWIPEKDRTICYVASDRMLGRVIACGTLFLDFEKKIGELSITKDPRYLPEGVGTDITRAIIREAISRGFRVIIHTSVENEAMIRVMEKLGYKPKRMIRCYEKYKDRIKAKNFDAYEWVITARSS